jgi:hypothetical protein
MLVREEEEEWDGDLDWEWEWEGDLDWIDLRGLFPLLGLNLRSVEMLLTTSGLVVAASGLNG